jgi:hypothetical protein
MKTKEEVAMRQTKEEQAEFITAKVRKEIASGQSMMISLLEHTGRYGAVNLKSGEMTIFHPDINILPEPHLSSADHVQRQWSVPLTVQGGNGTLPLNPGLTVVSGSTAVGKSTLVRALGVKRLPTVEVQDNINELSEHIYFDSIDQAVLVAARDTVNSGELHCIDSLRAALFEINGPAGSKGVIMPFFSALTRLSNSLARNGIAMLATVNPMDDDPEYIRQFLGKLSASVPCFIDLRSLDISRAGSGILKFSGTITSREIEGRITSPFTFSTEQEAGVSSEEVSFKMPAHKPSERPLSDIQVRQIQEY